MLIEATVYCHSMLRQYLFNDNSTLNVIVITDMELIITYKIRSTLRLFIGIIQERLHDCYLAFM